MLGVMRARLEAEVNPETGTCADKNETDPISCVDLPDDDGERMALDIVWCFPCKHMFIRSGIEGWTRMGNHTCPLCRTRIQELVPYGTSDAARVADRLAREAERDRAREEAREQAFAHIPPVQREELLQVIRFRRGIADSRMRTVERDHAVDRCARERWRRGQLGLLPDPILDVEHDVCIALSEMEHFFRAMLVHFIDRVELIHLCETESTAPADVARWRQENAGLVALVSYIWDHTPATLYAREYEALASTLEAMDVVESVADMRASYVRNTYMLVAGLRRLCDLGDPDHSLSRLSPHEFLVRIG